MKKETKETQRTRWGKVRRSCSRAEKRFGCWLRVAAAPPVRAEGLGTCFVGVSKGETLETRSKNTRLVIAPPPPSPALWRASPYLCGGGPGVAGRGRVHGGCGVAG